VFADSFTAYGGCVSFVVRQVIWNPAGKVSAPCKKNVATPGISVKEKASVVAKYGAPENGLAVREEPR
jgi:hypothetical protein